MTVGKICWSATWAAREGVNRESLLLEICSSTKIMEVVVLDFVLPGSSSSCALVKNQTEGQKVDGDNFTKLVKNLLLAR